MTQKKIRLLLMEVHIPFGGKLFNAEMLLFQLFFFLKYSIISIFSFISLKINQIIECIACHRPTQQPDGSLVPEDVSPPQIIREIQPNAKFLVTLSDPVKRMYSDYYFLDDNLRPVNRRSAETTKNAKQFHERVVIQVKKFNACVKEVEDELKNDLQISNHLKDFNDKSIWVRASQM